MSIYIVLLLQLLIASGTHVVAKSVIQHVDALPLTFFRSLLSVSGFLLLIQCRRMKFSFSRKHRNLLLFLGILAVINQFLYLYALKFTTAANGALLYATTPIFVLLFSSRFAKERLNPKKITGVTLAFLGVAFILVEKGINFHNDSMYGNCIMLLAVLCWSLYTTLGKSVVIEYGALPVTAYIALVGFIVIAPFGILSVPAMTLNSLTPMDGVGILYLGVGTSVVSYLLWYYALGRIDATSLAVFMNGQPVVATILSMIFLNYEIHIHFILGAFVTILGVVLTQTNSP
ncbi:MAG: DMT family transporter [Bacteroidetes bacterium]|nr:DMT family transporter [Bacteroidota bacterium]